MWVSVTSGRASGVRGGGGGLPVPCIPQGIRAGYRDVHMAIKNVTREGKVACQDTLDEVDKLEQEIWRTHFIHMELHFGMQGATVVAL